MTSISAATFEQRDVLIVSASFLRTTFGGSSAVYSLWLSQPCTSVVVVHLLLPSDTAGFVRLSSDRLCFTPDNFNQPQLVRVDALENRTQWSLITHCLYSLDKNYDRVLAPTVVVQTEDTPPERPLLMLGGIIPKRKATAKDSAQFTRLDLLAALPEDTDGDTTGGGASTQKKWCVSHLASGYHFSVAVVAQPKGATLLSWGLNTNGELGIGSMKSSPRPQQVLTFAMQLQREPLTITHVSCGKHHVAVITGQARLFTWGNNKYGQLGLGDFSPRTQPEEVHFALATLSSHRRPLRVMHTVQRGGNNVTHVACGAAHTLFVTHQQQILGMGYNQAGQLGLGHCQQQHKGWRSCTPIVVELLCDKSILDLAAGQNHSACALSNGDVYTWGCGDDGRLGDGKLGEGVANPTLVNVLREASVRVRAVRCGARHMAAISDNDVLYMWGANDFGQLGSKDKRPRARPFLLINSVLFAEGVEDVALGEFHTTCVTSAGKAYTWGLNLSDNTALVGSYASPQTIDLPKKERVRKVSCGWTHTNIVTNVNADKASASGQGTNFDKKIEQDRMALRKAEVVRWRAFVASTMPSTLHQTKRNCLRNAKGLPRTQETIAECAKQPARTIADVYNPEQPELMSDDEISSLKKLVVTYADLGMKDAEDKLAQLARVVCKQLVRIKQGNNTLERQAHQLTLKGVFYQFQLRPPEVPAITTCSSPSKSSGRKLWSAPERPLIRPDWNSTTLHPVPPSHSTPSIVSAKPKAATCGVPNSKQDDSVSNISDADTNAHDINKRCARTPTGLKRTTVPSPRSRVAVVEALMHQPSFSLIQGALSSAQSRSQTK